VSWHVTSRSSVMGVPLRVMRVFFNWGAYSTPTPLAGGEGVCHPLRRSASPVPVQNYCMPIRVPTKCGIICSRHCINITKLILDCVNYHGLVGSVETRSFFAVCGLKFTQIISPALQFNSTPTHSFPFDDIPFCTTNFSKRSFSFTAPTIWNELPAVIRESNTLDTFKRRLKTHLTSQAL